MSGPSLHRQRPGEGLSSEIETDGRQSERGDGEIMGKLSGGEWLSHFLLNKSTIGRNIKLNIQLVFVFYIEHTLHTGLRWNI